MGSIMVQQNYVYFWKQKHCKTWCPSHFLKATDYIWHHFSYSALALSLWVYGAVSILGLLPKVVDINTLPKNKIKTKEGKQTERVSLLNWSKGGCPRNVREKGYILSFSWLKRGKKGERESTSSQLSRASYLTTSCGWFLWSLSSFSPPTSSFSCVPG